MSLDPKTISAAARDAQAALEAFGIRDSFNVKVKDFGPAHADDVGLYRSRSQFRRGPIFWINKNLTALVPEPLLHGEIVMTLLHEYGHVIYEYARIRAPALRVLIDDVTDDEEDFAETFSIAVARGARAPTYRRIAAMFQRELGR